MLQFLTADQPPKGDPYALLLVILLAIVFVVWILIRNAKQKKAAKIEVSPVPTQKPATEVPKAPGSAGQLKLHNVEPKTAAMLMAIVADKMGKPLNELRFISIKEVE